MPSTQFTTYFSTQVLLVTQCGTCSYSLFFTLELVQSLIMFLVSPRFINIYLI